MRLESGFALQLLCPDSGLILLVHHLTWLEMRTTYSYLDC